MRDYVSGLSGSFKLEPPPKIMRSYGIVQAGHTVTSLLVATIGHERNNNTDVIRQRLHRPLSVLTLSTRISIPSPL